MLLADISKWIVLILIIGLVIFIIKVGTKIINIIIMILVLAFCWYSFFTEEGCARLSIALSGHPIVAYTTKLEKVENIKEKDASIYKIEREITTGKKIEYAKCYTKWIVRIPSVGE